MPTKRLAPGVTILYRTVLVAVCVAGERLNVPIIRMSALTDWILSHSSGRAQSTYILQLHHMSRQVVPTPNFNMALVLHDRLSMCEGHGARWLSWQHVVYSGPAARTLCCVACLSRYSVWYWVHAMMKRNNSNQAFNTLVKLAYMPCHLRIMLHNADQLISV